MDPFCDDRETTLRYGRYVSDLRRLLIFHGLHCGSPDDFEAVGTKLLESGAFRRDLSGLARSVRDVEAGCLSAEEMLTAVVLASSGKELVLEGLASSAGGTTTVQMLRLLLAGVGGWREANESDLPDRVEQPGESRLNHSNGSEPAADAGEILAMASAAAASAATETTSNGEQIQGRLELAITELKVYLDDIDRRIGRMEPRLEDITQVVHTSAELIQRPGKDPAEEKNNEAGQRGLISPSLSAETKAALVERAEVWRDGLIAKDVATSGRGVSEARSGEVMPQELASEATEVGTHGHVTKPSNLPTSLKIAAAEGSASAAAERQRADEVISAGPRQGSLPINAKPDESRKERVGRLLGIAAVLLAIVGLFGLPAFFRSPHEAIQLTGPERVRNDRVVSNTPPAREKVLQEQGQEQTEAHRTQPVEQTPLTGTVSGKERAGRERLATKRFAGPRADPPMKERRSPEQKVHSAGAQKLVATRETSALEVRPPKGVGGVGPRGLVDATDGRRSLPANGTPLIVPPAGMTRKLISAKAPVYPPEARREHMEGRVVLNAFIAKDGTVRRMDVLEGSKVFTKSAMAAISWRRYKPYLVRGKPVEVQTQITVNYPPGAEKKAKEPL